MSINIAGIWLTDTKPETFTQAYQAGQLYSMMENFLPNEPLPALAVCMVQSPAMRELCGERLWQKMKSLSKFRSRVTVYEKLKFQIGLPADMIGGPREFCLGYTYNHVRTKFKRNLDLKRTLAIPAIEEYLHSS